mgnify:CR=1 FL=1
MSKVKALPLRNSPPKKRYTFWFHFNKPESRRRKKAIWTVHFRGVCNVVDNIQCAVNAHTRSRKSQPYGVITGLCYEVTIDSSSNTAYIL